MLENKNDSSWRSLHVILLHFSEVVLLILTTVFCLSQMEQTSAWLHRVLLDVSVTGKEIEVFIN